jgi:hypothetical protein
MQKRGKRQSYPICFGPQQHCPVMSHVANCLEGCGDCDEPGHFVDDWFKVKGQRRSGKRGNDLQYVTVANQLESVMTVRRLTHQGLSSREDHLHMQ